jgi:hypothetical protein
MEDAASLFQQLPKEEYGYYLVNAVAAWQLVAAEPLTPEQLQRMVETLFSPGDGDDGNDDEDPISATS